MEPIKISNYFKIIHPEYCFVKVMPLKSIRNYNSEKIVTAFSSTYKRIEQQFSRREKRIEFKRQAKFSYMVYIEKGSICFYFILPKEYLSMFKEKILETWKGVTLDLVDSVPMFSANAAKYSLIYKKNDSLSLATDSRNNALLSALFAVVEVMEEGDKCGVIYNFIPCDQHNWRADYDHTIKQMKCGYPVEKEKVSKGYVFKLFVKAFYATYVFAIDILLSVFDDKFPKDDKVLLKDLGLSSATTAKRESPVVKAQVVLLSESISRDRQRDVASSLCQAFDALKGDNALVKNKMPSSKKPINYESLYIKNAAANKVSPAEAQSFLSLPGKSLIEERKIECISSLETEVPTSLQRGYIPLGVNTFRGNLTEAFFPSSLDAGSLPFVAVGEQGCGKSTFFINYVLNCIAQGEGCLVLDYIKNCELSHEIERRVPDKNKLIILDFASFADLQGFGYNELKPRSLDPNDILDVAFRKAMYISMLIDALVPDEPLSPTMDCYLSAASNIVLLNPEACLKDVLRCLLNHEFRARCIENIPEMFRESLEDEIVTLKELDSVNKKEQVDGTKTTKIEGILHRINLLKKDLRLKTMFSKSSAQNIDLANAMDEGKCVLIKMPQEFFSTPYVKNTIVTYWFTKVWSSMLVRGGKQERPKRFHVLVDEVFQAKTAMRLLKEHEILPQTRKFGCRYGFSCQHLKQIKEIDPTLRAAGASYLLMKGSGKASFKEFAEELDPYTLEHVESLPQYHSLNIINYESGRAKFITALPKLPKQICTT